MVLRPFGVYCSACFGSLFVSILCTCCSHFFWYSFISFTMFCAPVFSLIRWFFSLSSFVIPSKCLKNFICAASKRCPSLFLSTQVSLPNFNAALAVILWILNFVWIIIIIIICLIQIQCYLTECDVFVESRWRTVHSKLESNGEMVLVVHCSALVYFTYVMSTNWMHIRFVAGWYCVIKDGDGLKLSLSALLVPYFLSAGPSGRCQDTSLWVTGIPFEMRTMYNLNLTVT